VARAALQAKRCDAAIAAARVIPASLPNPEGAARGVAPTLCGHREEGLRVLGEFRQQAQRGYVVPTKVAMLYAALGEKDSAFAWLQRGYEGRDAFMVFMQVEPVYDPVRADPRFARLLQQVGLGPGNRGLP
jgi:hypothetical protein